MRNHVDVLKAKAKKDPKVAALVDLVENGKIDQKFIENMDEPNWLKSSLLLLVKGQGMSLKETLKRMEGGIKIIDTSDRTPYEAYRYAGDTWVGARLAIKLSPGDLFLALTDRRVMVRQAEKEASTITLVRNSHPAGKMTIEEYKMAYRQDIRKRHGDPTEESQDQENNDGTRQRGMFTIRRM